MPNTAAGRLREAAKAAGMNAAAISNESGISESTVRRALNGEGDTTVTTLTAICEVISTSPEFVIYGRTSASSDWGIRDYYEARIKELHNMYERRIAVNKELYERQADEAAAQKAEYLALRDKSNITNKRQRWIIAGLVVLILWLVLIDRHLPHTGAIQYETLEDFLKALTDAGYRIIAPPLQ